MKHFILSLILCLSFTLAYSQSEGKEFSAYIFPEFIQGKVLMKTGMSYNALLNYDALTEEMVFVNKSKKLAIAGDEVELVDTIVISGRKFVTLDHKFVELVYDSAVILFAGYKCKLSSHGKPGAYGDTSQTAAITTASGFYTGTTRYELSSPDLYQVKPYTWYWLMKNGKLSRFINFRQLSSIYRDKDEKLKKYLENNVVIFEEAEDVVLLIRFLEKDE